MKKVYIWGTGCESEKCISNINREKCQIMGFVETKPDKEIWKNKTVYPCESIPQLEYDYIIIANTYFVEIFTDIRRYKLADESKVINWIVIRECIYHYPKEVWSLFSDKFIENNFYLLDTKNEIRFFSLGAKLDKYDEIYIYDMRLINSELNIGALINEILYVKSKPKIGMIIIPNEDLLDDNWYHNLLYVIDRNAFVLWKELESAYEDYIKNNPEKFSFRKFKVVEFERRQRRTVHKGKYMQFGTRLLYKEKQNLIDKAKHIKIYNIRCDRIGEEIRVLNKVLFDNNDENDIFNIYIPIDENCKPYEGTNACFDEIVGRKINLLNNKDEYALCIQDIYEKSDKYEYVCEQIDVYHSDCGIKKMYQPLIDFKDEELTFGRRLIADRLGISREYVCLFTRDAEYLKKLLPHTNYAYHNYRDASFDVMNKAIDYFNQYRIQTVRMGQIAEQKEIYGGCINFTNQGYDEFTDLILYRFCKFFLGTFSGVAEIPILFGRPAVHLLPFYPIIEHNLFRHKEDICIFNRIYSRDKGRELTISETFDVAIEFRVKYICRGEYFSEHGLELIPFSQDDIRDVAKEMNEKLDGIWTDESEDDELRRILNLKIKAVMDKNHRALGEVYPMAVATSFLRKYKYLLED